MNWEVLGAVGAFGQFLVLFVAAIVAFEQIRQVHKQNELQALMPLLLFSNSAEFFKLREEARALAELIPEDAALREEIVAGKITARITPVFRLCNFSVNLVF